MGNEPCPVCGKSFCEDAPLHSARLENTALRARVAELEGAMREIVTGKIEADNAHPLGPLASMVLRFLNIANAALAAGKGR